MILIVVRLDFVGCDVDLFQPQPLRQIRRHEASDLQSLQIIEGGGERTTIQEREQEGADKEPGHDYSSGGGTRHVAIVTELTALSRLNPPMIGLREITLQPRVMIVLASPTE